MPDQVELNVGGDEKFATLKPQVQSGGVTVKSSDPLEDIAWLKRDDIWIAINNPSDTYIVARDDSAANVSVISSNHLLVKFKLRRWPGKPLNCD